MFLFVPASNGPQIMPLLDTYVTRDGVRVLVLPRYEPFDVSRKRSLADIAALFDKLLQVHVR